MNIQDIPDSDLPDDLKILNSLLLKPEPAPHQQESGRMDLNHVNSTFMETLKQMNGRSSPGRDKHFDLRDELNSLHKSSTDYEENANAIHKAAEVLKSNLQNMIDELRTPGK